MVINIFYIFIIIICIKKFFQCINQANLAISNGKLNVLPRFQTCAINSVVYDGSIGRTSFELNFSSGFNY